MNYPIKPGIRNLFPNEHYHMKIPDSEKELLEMYYTYKIDDIVWSKFFLKLRNNSNVYFSKNSSERFDKEQHFQNTSILSNTIKCLEDIKSILFGQSYLNFLEKENQGYRIKIDWDNYIKKHLKDFDKISKTLYCKYYPCLPVCVEYIDGELTINY